MAWKESDERMKTDSQSGTKSPWNEKGKTFLFLSNPRKLKSVINQRAMFSLKYKLLLIRRFWFSNQWKFVPTLWPISFLRTCFLPLANQILRVLLQAFFCRKTYLFFFTFQEGANIRYFCFFLGNQWKPKFDTIFNVSYKKLKSKFGTFWPLRNNCKSIYIWYILLTSPPNPKFDTLVPFFALAVLSTQ